MNYKYTCVCVCVRIQFMNDLHNWVRHNHRHNQKIIFRYSSPDVWFFNLYQFIGCTNVCLFVLATSYSLLMEFIIFTELFFLSTIGVESSIYNLYFVTDSSLFATDSVHFPPYYHPFFIEIF